MTSATDSILLTFFNRLRKSAGMELDMTQYHLFLELFMKGYGRDYDSLLNLCKTLWLTQARYKDSFKTWFDEAWGDLNKHWLPEAVSLPENERPEVEPKPIPDKSAEREDGEKPTTDATQVETEKTKDNLLEPEKPKEDVTEKKEPSMNLMDVMLNFDEGGSKSAPSGKGQNGKPSEKDTAFIFSDEKHLPVQPRRLGHALQKLRMTETFRTGEQLDMPCVVRQFGKERFLHQLDYERVNSSSQNVLLLTDHEGSMSAFETWGEFLYRSLGKHPSIERIERYYFHDHPTAVGNSFKLFTNPNHTASLPAGQVLAKASDKFTWLIIFSDAGAYEPGLDAETLQYWWRFLEMTQRQVAAITWLNPLPERRWEGNMAGYLSFLVKMVPFHLEGVRQAIKWANNANRNRTA